MSCGTLKYERLENVLRPLFYQADSSFPHRHEHKDHDQEDHDHKHS